MRRKRRISFFQRAPPDTPLPFFTFAHRAKAALRAMADRRSGVNDSALARPSFLRHSVSVSTTPVYACWEAFVNTPANFIFSASISAANSALVFILFYYARKDRHFLNRKFRWVDLAPQ